MSTTSAASIAADQARRATSSVARVEANRRNAQKSTGPRTAEGKARVSENALKHGLRSERNPLDLATDACLPIEREEFLATLADLTAEFAPRSPLESRLVERLAQIDLRLNRAARIETAMFDRSAVRILAKEAATLPDDDQRVRNNYLLMRSFTDANYSLNLIARYESRLARDFARTLAQLRATRKLREQTQPEQSNASGMVAPASRTNPDHAHPTASSPSPKPTERTGRPAEPAPLCAVNILGKQTQLDAKITSSAPERTASALCAINELDKQTQPNAHLIAKSPLAQRHGLGQ